MSIHDLVDLIAAMFETYGRTATAEMMRAYARVLMNEPVDDVRAAIYELEKTHVGHVPSAADIHTTVLRQRAAEREEERRQDWRRIANDDGTESIEFYVQRQTCREVFEEAVRRHQPHKQNERRQRWNQAAAKRKERGLEYRWLAKEEQKDARIDAMADDQIGFGEIE